MDILTASSSDFAKIKAFYFHIIDGMAESPYRPGWEKEVYPADAQLKTAIAQGQLFFMQDNGQIVGSFILNHDAAEGYEKIPWGKALAPEEVLIIHALGIAPEKQKSGLAKKAAGFILNYAETKGLKAVRLDVLKGNLPAERLYQSLGFARHGSLKLFYEDTGLTDFILYEYLL